MISHLKQVFDPLSCLLAHYCHLIVVEARFLLLRKGHVVVGLREIAGSTSKYGGRRHGTPTRLEVDYFLQRSHYLLLLGAALRLHSSRVRSFGEVWDFRLFIMWLDLAHELERREWLLRRDLLDDISIGLECRRCLFQPDLMIHLNLSLWLSGLLLLKANRHLDGSIEDNLWPFTL